MAATRLSKHKKLVAALRQLAIENYGVKHGGKAPATEKKRKSKYSDRARNVSAAIRDGAYGCYAPHMIGLMHALLGEPIPPLGVGEPAKGLRDHPFTDLLVKVIANPNSHNYDTGSLVFASSVDKHGLRDNGTMGNYLPLDELHYKGALEAVDPDSAEFKAFFTKLAKTGAAVRLAMDHARFYGIDKYLKA